MPILADSRRHLLTALHDGFMAAASFLLALYLRLGDRAWVFGGRYLAFATTLCTLVCLLVFARARLYRGLWRYASTPDLVAITRAATVAILLFYLILFIATRLEGMPRSVPFIEWLLLLALLGGPRFLYRVWRDRRLGLRLDARAESRIPVLLLGAGDRAEIFLRDTRSGSSAQYVVVGIVDDDPARIGHSIHNVRIYGGSDRLGDVVAELAGRGLKPQRAILTDDALPGARINALLERTERLGLPLSRLPRLSEFKPGTEDRLTLYPIAVEDLLGRPQNVHDPAPIRELIVGKTVLVTGAGGTIGSELARQISGFAPARLLLLDSSEFALYQIDRELARDVPQVMRSALLADVRSASHLDAIFTREKPEIVFHAAAIKHVPLAEANPEEAILTNLFGTQAIAEAAAKAGVLAFVLISTDKAVNPWSVMGASKRAAEEFCQALAHEPASRGITRFSAVRFGNVLGSTGSVVPLFQEQLARGGPLTVTHPEMVRYFMTVREAVELVLKAATLPGENGEVYVLDMGEPVRILTLAEQMIRLAGRKPHEDIKIEFTGLRAGEKMFEEMFHPSEDSGKTGHAGIWIAGARHEKLAAIQPVMAELREACERRRPRHALEALRRLVPEYRAS